jgi:ABC-2 type transport system permease protein
MCDVMQVWTVVHSEWTKQRTVAGPGLMLLAVVVGTLALGAAASAAVSCPGVGCSVDPVKTSLTGVLIGQAIIAVLAVLTVGAEYSTGMIDCTLTATPRRWLVLVAKASILTGPVLVAGCVAVLGSMVVGGLLQPSGAGGPGNLSLTLGDPSSLRAAGGSVLYLALIALFSLGIATIVRSSAAAIGIVLGLLFVFPILTAVVTDPDWQRHLKQIAPSSAGLAIQVTTNVDDLPISPWAGLGVLGLWAAGALLVGGIALELRDV